MRYAIFQTGGKQYRVQEGDVITVERLKDEANKNITFPQVLLFVSENDCKIGSPYVDGVSIIGKVLSHPKGEKIRVAKFKAKARYRRVQGHRQSLTEIKIEEIASGDKKKETPVKESAPKKESAAKTVKKAKK